MAITLASPPTHPHQKSPTNGWPETQHTGTAEIRTKQDDTRVLSQHSRKARKDSTGPATNQPVVKLETVRCESG